jgi:hypothetical protein
MGELLWRGRERGGYLVCSLQGALEREAQLQESLWRQVGRARRAQDSHFTAALFSLMERNRVRLVPFLNTQILVFCLE